MLRLAIDTSTDLGSTALGRGEDLLGEVVLGTRIRHAEALLPAIAFLLESTGHTRQDLEGVVVGAGPGSFTGVRIAAATAKGLVRVLRLPLWAPSSLAAAAASVACGDRPVCALFDARREEVYAGCWQLDAGGLRQLAAPRVGRLADVLRDVERFGPVFVGDGASRYRELLPAGSRVGPPGSGVPRASALLRMVAADEERSRVADPARWQPDYLRTSGAERNLA